jgi:hypothetical protein
MIDDFCSPRHARKSSQKFLRVLDRLCPTPGDRSERMKINVRWETGCGRRDAGCATGHIIDHAALRKSSITSKKAFKGVQRVVLGRDGTAFIRLYLANSPYFAFFKAGADSWIQAHQRKADDHAENVTKAAGKPGFRPPLPGFARLVRLFYCGREAKSSAATRAETKGRNGTIKRTGVAKTAQKWCGNLQIVRICPLMPASSAFARFILGRARTAAFQEGVSVAKG